MFSGSQVAAESVEQLIANGDHYWSLRAEGSTDIRPGFVASKNIQTAIEYYQAAIKLAEADPLGENLQRIELKLIEALYFRGYFTTAEKSQKKQLYDRCRELSVTAMDRLRKIAVSSGVTVQEDIFESSPAAQAQVFSSVPKAQEVYFWSAITWGLWGMTFGNLASARESVADKVRDYSEVLILLNSDFADGGGYRLLGRLHSLAPRVPFFTGWVSRTKGVELLRKAYSVSNRDPRNALFLAEALLEQHSRDKPETIAEAKRLLLEVARFEIDTSYRVEQTEQVDQAKRLLREDNRFRQ